MKDGMTWKEYIVVKTNMIQRDYEAGWITEAEYHDALDALACILTGML